MIGELSLAGTWSCSQTKLDLQHSAWQVSGREAYQLKQKNTLIPWIFLVLVFLDVFSCVVSRSIRKKTDGITSHGRMRHSNFLVVRTDGPDQNVQLGFLNSRSQIRTRYRCSARHKFLDLFISRLCLRLFDQLYLRYNQINQHSVHTNQRSRRSREKQGNSVVLELSLLLEHERRRVSCLVL